MRVFPESWSKRLNRWRAGRSFGADLAAVAGGTAVAQVAVVAASPLLTRLYSPADWGVLAVYSSVLSLFYIASSLRYEIAIPIPESDDDAFGLMQLSLVLVSLMGLLSLGVVWGVGGGRLGPEGEALVNTWGWLLPLGVVWSGFNKVLSSWAVRTREFAALGRTKIAQGVGQVLTQAGLGLIGAGPVGLVSGDVVGRAGGTLTLWNLASRSRSIGGSALDWRGLMALARRFKDFALLSTPSSLLNTGGLRLPAVLLAAFYGATATGWYGLCGTIAAGPISLIGRPMSQVFAGHMTQAIRDRRPVAARLLFQVSRKLLLGAVVPILLVAVAAPWGFRVVFGPDWTDAGTLLRIMAPMLLMQIVVFPLSLTLTVLERQGVQLAWDVARFVAVVLALAVPGMLGWSVFAAVGLLSAVMSASYVVLLLLSFRVARQRDQALIVARSTE